MPGLGETQLMSSQSYFSMKINDNITIEMDIMDIIFKDGSTFLVEYDANKNLPLLDCFQDDYATKFLGIVYKCATETTILNLGC